MNSYEHHSERATLLVREKLEQTRLETNDFVWLLVETCNLDYPVAFKLLIYLLDKKVIAVDWQGMVHLPEEASPFIWT